jgi:polysaccharide export outer membrane protein
MRLSDLIKDPVADLLPTADLDLGLIKRVDPVSLKVSVVPFQLMVALEYPGSPQDPLLEDRDTLILFARPDLEREEPGINSRAELLGPIIKEFRSQASDTSPIALVSISGGVKAPGTYPLFNGATVGDLIGFAGGLRDSAFARAAELRRLVSRNDESLGVTYQELDLSKADSGDWNRILSSRDHVTVRSIPNWSPIDRIVVEGEVAFPGEYLVQDGETLASVIERAGGLTSEAFPEGAVFIRKEVAEQERRRLRDFASKIRRNFASRMLTQEQPTSSIAEIADIVDELDNVEGLGRVLIDLKGALAGDKSANINVVDADQIIIPKRTQVVTVVGEVREQGNHSFEANLSLDDYLALSAGLTDRADEQSIYIIRPNGSVSMASSSWWRFSGRAQLIAPGDTIVVPVNTQYQETLVAWREVTQIIYQGVVTIAALGSL